MSYGTEKRKKHLEESINKVLDILHGTEEQLDTEDDSSKSSALEKRINRLKERLKTYEEELEKINESDDGVSVIKNIFDQNVAVALVQLAKAWASDQNKAGST